MTQMKKIMITLVCAFLLVPSFVFAFDMSPVKAYPVPFNPKKAALRAITINGFGTFQKIKIEVFDINGDLVTTKEDYNKDYITWDGRNKSGNLVKPGLYIIKIIVKNEATNTPTPADHGQKLIRVLVQY